MATALLKEIDVDLIDRNPENPRVVFRPGEMSQLMDSIRRLGVQVPISVYKEGGRFVLIDGERRWRSSIKLNKKTIPAIIQEKPSSLQNLLLMFNIHALREQWDLLTIALKLPRVISLLREGLGRAPNEKDISGETGLSLGVIRRCKLLIDLPDRHKQIILRELRKPKSQQKLTEDFYIEMERALKTVERAMPDVFPKGGKETVRNILIKKYSDGVITNLIHFRQIGKIARAKNVDADEEDARIALTKLFTEPSYSIEQAYGDSVSNAYIERDLATRANGLADYLSQVESDTIDDDALKALEHLFETLHEFLEGEQ
ncbi:ParB/RepB/Spo0J family partition protein [Pseudoxanthomonas sacheonensis]|uniref:ParB/RepB/Spo0J family partition protein n=1 Tax=Pseudoxanthomonas sacheonensis TaxID=443615 RepID=A0ABU1RSX8_9GAMM|nr:ParB/RepB/Spo0J family partition protein [Pseudoxanthomonas sacheonensis]MDR6841025.1 ParB/RepB/Spo0J family partition protein [Pseudoxanthomonas sacheonensis]